MMSKIVLRNPRSMELEKRSVPKLSSQILDAGISRREPLKLLVSFTWMESMMTCPSAETTL